MQHEVIPTRFTQIIFRSKATLLRARRMSRDLSDGIVRYPLGNITDFPYIIAESRSPLWGENAETEWYLEAGKVQNLRVALRHLHRAQIPEAGTFSFWKQIGQATRRRGYVEGRLLREGCLIPAVGGGLCQLSNALYDVALQADLPIAERWAHSRIVPGSAASWERDATVAWNYIDLRFRPEQDIFIEAFLAPDELVVRLRGREKTVHTKPKIITVSSIDEARPVLDAQAHSCASCQQQDCFRFRQGASSKKNGCTAFLVDERWPEFENFVVQNHSTQDILAIPLDGARWHQARYAWRTDNFRSVHAATIPTLIRSFATRRLGAYGAARLQSQIEHSKKLANHLSRALTPDVTHVVVAQSLLPFLWRGGHLGGRTVEVLMTRLPLHVLQDRLDSAALRHPERKTLCQFRAPNWLVDAEEEALQNAHVITPHGEIASLFEKRVKRLNWIVPPQRKRDTANSSRVIAFLGPTAARKGAYEVRDAARSLGLEVALRGSELEGENFWSGIKTRPAVDDWLENIAAVVQPSLVEDQPRHLLQALAAGVPVIATAASGLEPTNGLTLVPAEDTAALIDVITAIPK